VSKLLDLFDDLTGVVLDYALSTPPSSKWLMCYGQPLLEGDAAAARLRAKLIADGFPHGQSGSDPLVPDVRERATAGWGNMGGTPAGRLTVAGSGIDGSVLGASGGAQSVTLTTLQMPAHGHTVTDPGHTHTINTPSGTPVQAGGITADAGATSSPRNSSQASTGITIADAGGGLPHNNTQPTLIMNKIIRL
jgi:microcystin-dependent protein